MKTKTAVLALIVMAASAVAIARTIYRGPLVYEAALAYNKNYTLNVANYGITSLGATASYSSTTVTSQQFTDGTASTGSITVASLTGLAGSQGTNTITISTQAGLSGSSIQIGGTTLTESIQWYTQTSTNSVATSIKSAINTYAPQFVATIGTSKNVVTVTCGSSGTWCNSQTLAVVGTSSITVGSASFTGGVDNAIVTINNVNFNQGSATGQWAVTAATATTANAISVAINANTSINSLVTSTAPVACGLTNPCGIVKLTALTVGTASNYALYSSSQSALTLSGPVTITAGRGVAAMTGGTASATSANSALITIANNQYWPKNVGQTGLLGIPVLYSSSTITLGGLVNQTTYYVIPVDKDTISLASSSANAQAGTAITITSSSTQTTAHTFTLAPLAITGNPGMKWQVSNDGSLWTDFTTTSSGVAVSSVTVTSYTFGGASTSWDFGTFGYAYIRLAVTAPTAGGVNLLVTMNGRNQE